MEEINSCIKFENKQLGKQERILMDAKWKFHLGDIPLENTYWGLMKAGTCNQGGCRSKFDDSTWRTVDLPHDFVVEGTFAPSSESFGNNHGIPEMWSLGNIHTTRGSLSGQIAWYRKVFYISEGDCEKRIYIQFDGIYRDCDIYLNDFYIGSHKSGYTSFLFDLSDFIHFGGDNILAVKVDATQAEGWYYDGGGIYRHVWLIKSNPVHIIPWGIYATAQVDITDENHPAKVKIKTTIANKIVKDAVCHLVSEIVNPNGEIVGSIRSEAQIASWDQTYIEQSIDLQKSQVWSLEEPNLYKVVSTIYVDQLQVDQCCTVFGIRDIRFDPYTGFYLNGKPVKLQGVCCHQDHAGLGVALPDRVQEYRIIKLKEMGCNAYRASHHPPTPELLEACDRLGMLVIDENRLASSSSENLSQLESLVLRDRNHPSIILWCLGNEEARIKMTSEGARIVNSMKQCVLKSDTSRHITFAIDMRNWHDSRILDVSEVQAVSTQLDVMGFNYFPDTWGKYHELFPKQPIVITEDASGLRTRGCYETDNEKCHISGMDKSFVQFNSGERQWKIVAEHAYICGTFLWTGFDYRGEPSPRPWPAISSQFGVMDTCGFPKDNYYYFKSWWSSENVLHIFPHWNWPEKVGQPVEVWCFSNCDEVELFLNGTSLGKKVMELNGHLEWSDVIYAPGTLNAIGYKKGVEVTQTMVQTTGSAYAIRLIPHLDKIQGDQRDVSIVNVEIIDNAGRVVPTGDNEISFQVAGQGKIIGVGNGDPSSHEPDKSSRRRAFNGFCQVIIQSTEISGEIYLTAKAIGLMQDEITIRTIEV